MYSVNGGLHFRVIEVLPQAFGYTVFYSFLVICVRSLSTTRPNLIGVWEEEKDADRRMPLAADMPGPQAVAGFSSPTEIMQVN